MKKLSKSQISLMSTVEDLIYSSLFKKIMSQGRVSFEDAEINFGKWEFKDDSNILNIKVPTQKGLTTQEAEILKNIEDIMMLTTFNEKNISIFTDKEELYNFLLFLIRQARN